jgi:hypothetical protein
MEASTK